MPHDAHPGPCPGTASARDSPASPNRPAAYAPARTHPGRLSVRSTHSLGGAPALPAAITPPTMAQVVSMSPPTWAVDQKPSS